MYQKILSLLQENFSERSITANDINFVSQHLNKKNTIIILQDILSQPELLSKIEERSYTHALGFDKIVLADLSKDISSSLPKAQIRLHLWDPENTQALPIVESLHEHSFDFISTVLSGYLENQQFTFSDMLSEKENTVLSHILSWTKHNPVDIIQSLNQDIECLEAKRLEIYGSQQFVKMYNDQIYTVINRISQLTHLSKNDIIDSLLNIQGHYVSDRIAGEKKAYKHVLKKYVSIKPHDILSINEGEYYYHPYTLPHRLFYDNSRLNATILLTTPVSSNPEGGSLQRPTYVQKETQEYNKISYESGQLKIKLESFIEYLNNH